MNPVVETAPKKPISLGPIPYKTGMTSYSLQDRHDQHVGSLAYLQYKLCEKIHQQIVLSDDIYEFNVALALHKRMQNFSIGYAMIKI